MGSDQAIFECTQCGDCCRGYGGTYVSETDIAKIADFIGVPVAEFKKGYCTLSGNRPVLSQQTNGYCIFFNRNCTIHAVKPDMCRKWPFIQSLRTDIANWRIMASVCPGMRSDLDDAHLLSALEQVMGAF